MAPADEQILYRLIGRSTARLRDFQSDRDKGRPRFADQSYLDYLGLSVFESSELAVDNAALEPVIVASVRMSADEGLMLARTEVDIEGHYSVWGDAAVLLASVVRVDRYS